MHGLIAWIGVCAMVLLAPFERLTPLVAWPGQSLTTVETALACVFAVWFITMVWTRAMPAWRTPLTLPWIVLLAVMLAAAAAAPAHGANAARMVGRFAVGFGVFLLALNGTTTSVRLRGVLWAAAAAGAIVSSLVLMDYLDVGIVTEWLTAFRERISVVGPQVRASGPFQYPTIASMYLEIVFALVLGPLLIACDAKRRSVIALVFLLLVAIAVAITLTFTRAGLVTMAAALAIVGVRRYRRHGVDGAVTAIVALSVLIGGQFLISRPAEAVMLRLTTEGQQSWYRAVVDAPAEITMPAGAIVPIPVKLTNLGRSTWDPTAAAPFLLSYHWLEAEGERVVEFEGLRTAFPTTVAPGATVAVDARVKAPGLPGRYRLLWDVVLERRLWFSTDPAAERYFTQATVTGSPVGPPPVSRVTTMPRAAPPPDRFTLWRAGLRMVRAHPLLGVGPDNFRMTYGAYAGLSAFDARAHSNSMYLEMFAGGGILGGLAFVWLCVAARRAIGSALRREGPQTAAAAAGVAAAGAAIAIHGIVDSFLGFTGPYVLISITLGLAASAAMNTQDVHRGRDA